MLHFYVTGQYGITLVKPKRLSPGPFAQWPTVCGVGPRAMPVRPRPMGHAHAALRPLDSSAA